MSSEKKKKTQKSWRLFVFKPADIGAGIVMMCYESDARPSSLETVLF